MKKTLTLAAAALMTAALMTSCKKDYTCTCTTNGQSSSTPMGKTTKKSAKDACAQLQTLANQGGSTGTSCSL